MYWEGGYDTSEHRAGPWSARIARVLTAAVIVATIALLATAPAFAATVDSYEPDSRLDMHALDAGAAPLERSIGVAGDVDWVSLQVQAGRTYVLEAAPDPTDPWVDLGLDVYQSGSTSAFASDDDGGANLMPRLTLTAPTSGTWHIRVAGHSEWTVGPYSIAAREIPAATLTGTATGLAGIPVGSALVTVYAHDSLGWSAVASALTDATGAYRFVLEAGTYRLGARQGTGQGTFFPSAITVEDGSDIELAAGEQRTLPSVSALRWTYVTGTVTASDGSQPVAGVSVAAYRYVNGEWKAFSWTSTDTDGSWHMPLAEDTYKFGFTDRTGLLAPGFSGDVDTLEAAHTVQVTQDTPPLVTRLHAAPPASTPSRESAPSVHAIAGQDRYGTAVQVSREAFPDGADSVIVVTGTSWPDGLGAASLAGALDAPILLVKPDAIPAVVAAEIERLSATRAVIVGGPSAVGAMVERDLQLLVGAGAIHRVGGHDRYETARLVAEETIRTLETAGTPWDGTYILASGLSFPDVLAASPLSAAQGWPVLLTKPATLTGQTLRFLSAHPHSTPLVVGGSAVVSDEVLERAASMGEAPTRIFGQNRYETAVRIAEYANARNLLDYSRVAIATGQDFPDALTCSVLQAGNESVLLLTPGSKVDSRVASLLESLPAEECAQITFVGGSSAISQGVRNTLAAGFGD